MEPGLMGASHYQVFACNQNLIKKNHFVVTQLIPLFSFFSINKVLDSFYCMKYVPISVQPDSHTHTCIDLIHALPYT